MYLSEVYNNLADYNLMYLSEGYSNLAGLMYLSEGYNNLADLMYMYLSEGYNILADLIGCKIPDHNIQIKNGLYHPTKPCRSTNYVILSTQ